MNNQKPQLSEKIKYTILLEAAAENDTCSLRVLQDTEDIPFQVLVEKYKVLNVFNTLLDEEDGRLFVPLNKLKKVRHYLAMFSNGLLGSVEIKITSDVESILAQSEISKAKRYLSSGDGLAEITLDDGCRGETLPISVKPDNFINAKPPMQKTEYVTLKDLGYKVRRGASNSSNDFIRDAERLAEYVGAEAERIPFSCYYPTYDAMTEAQQKWYFWWRQNARRKEYMETDLSYLFVHIYELINQIGTRNVRDGYEQLVNLWHNYRSKYPKLDNYLSIWIHDYITVYSCEFSEQDAITLLCDHNLTRLSFDWIVNYFYDKLIAQIPLSFFRCLSDFPLENSKFYGDGHSEEFANFLCIILARVDVFLQATRGKGILKYYSPGKDHETRRLAFPGAIYINSRIKTIDVSVIPYSTYVPLRNFITAIVKQTENKLREIHKVKGRLKGIEIEKDLQQFIDDQLSAIVKIQKEEAGKVQIFVDQEKVASLINDSDWVRERLLEGIEDVYTETMLNTTDVSSETMLNTADSYAHTDAAVKQPELTFTDLPDEWKEFLQGLEEYQTETMKILSSCGNVGKRERISEICEQYLVLPQMLMDMINNIALDTLGDLLIDTESPEPDIFDEYKDMLNKIFNK